MFNKGIFSSESDTISTVKDDAFQRQLFSKIVLWWSVDINERTVFIYDPSLDSNTASSSSWISQVFNERYDFWEVSNDLWRSSQFLLDLDVWIRIYIEQIKDLLVSRSTNIPNLEDCAFRTCDPTWINVLPFSKKNKSFQINFNNWRYLIQYWGENRNISNINIIEINSWKLFSIQENIITGWCHMPLSSRNNEPEYTMQSECFIRFKKSLKNHHS